MRIDELRSGMVLRKKYTDWTPGMIKDGADTVYVVPAELTFLSRDEGWNYSKRSVRTPELEVWFISYTEGSNGAFFAAVERNTMMPMTAVPGRDLVLVANSMEEAMQRGATFRAEQHERYRQRDEMTDRCYQIYEDIEELTGYRSRYLDRRQEDLDRGEKRTSWNLSHITDIPVETLEQLIAMAKARETV